MESRAYFFTNMYISDIQRGIQTAHCISDIHMKYKDNRNDILEDWAANHKTMIVLNGGYSSHLKEIINIFEDQNDLPWDRFYESMDALDGALTCVGIVIPENVYNMAKAVSENTPIHRTDDTIEIHSINFDTLMCKNTVLNEWLINNLSNYRLA